MGRFMVGTSSVSRFAECRRVSPAKARIMGICLTRVNFFAWGDGRKCNTPVIPAQAGTQGIAGRLDPRLRGDDRSNGSLRSWPSGHLILRIHLTSVLMSASLTWELGGIGTWPQTPTPPALTFCSSFACAPL